jgi:hypothetical protein
MIDTHKKLAQGIIIDVNAVSVLLLGGIINIINQHDMIADLEKKMKNILLENITNKIRIEMIENWVQKQDDLIKKLDEKLSVVDQNGVIFRESQQIDIIQKKLSKLEIELSSPKRNLEKNAKEEGKPPKSNVFRCDQCDASFGRNCDLEKHFDDDHQKLKNTSAIFVVKNSTSNGD